MLTSERKILNDDELLFNILFQTYISIATFQNMLKYIHRDAHYGNFLYQENNEIGYYHYIFNGNMNGMMNWTNYISAGYVLYVLVMMPYIEENFDICVKEKADYINNTLAIFSNLFNKE
jgi:hypothetical protein